MAWSALLAAVLVLHPVLDEPGAVRLVAAGTEDETIVWHVDGVEVATSSDREPVTLDLPAGEHEVTAETEHEGAWRALVRPEPAGGSGATQVEGWMASTDGAPAPRSSGFRVADVPTSAWVLGALGLVLVLVPNRRGRGERR